MARLRERSQAAKVAQSTAHAVLGAWTAGFGGGRGRGRGSNVRGVIQLSGGWGRMVHQHLKYVVHACMPFCRSVVRTGAPLGPPRLPGRHPAPPPFRLSVHNLLWYCSKQCRRVNVSLLPYRFLPSLQCRPWPSSVSHYWRHVVSSTSVAFAVFFLLLPSGVCAFVCCLLPACSCLPLYVLPADGLLVACVSSVRFICFFIPPVRILTVPGLYTVSTPSLIRIPHR